MTVSQLFVAELGEIANALGVPLSVLTDVRASA